MWAITLMSPISDCIGTKWSGKSWSAPQFQSDKLWVWQWSWSWVSLFNNYADSLYTTTIFLPSASKLSNCAISSDFVCQRYSKQKLLTQNGRGKVSLKKAFYLNFNSIFYYALFYVTLLLLQQNLVVKLQTITKHLWKVE